MKKLLARITGNKKLLGLTVALALAIVGTGAGVVYALNTIDTGWQVNVGASQTKDVTYYSNVNETAQACKRVTNNNTLPVFVPTKSGEEWNAFAAAAPGKDIVLSGCYSWSYNGYGSCSQSCGWGTKTTSYTCKDSSGNPVSSSLCGPYPSTSSKNCHERNCSYIAGTGSMNVDQRYKCSDRSDRLISGTRPSGTTCAPGYTRSMDAVEGSSTPYSSLDSGQDCCDDGDINTCYTNTDYDWTVTCTW